MKKCIKCHFETNHNEYNNCPMCCSNLEYFSDNEEIKWTDELKNQYIKDFENDVTSENLAKKYGVRKNCTITYYANFITEMRELDID